MTVKGSRAPRSAWVAVVGGLAAALLGAAPAQAANVNVSYGSNFYSPQSVRIAPADTVTWQPAAAGQDFVLHPLSGPNPPFGATTTSGTTRTIAFPTAGSYAYICTRHNALGMNGTVVVSANRPPTASFTASAATAGQPVTFTSTSSDPNPGQTLSYQWDLDGNGAYDAGVGGATATRTYAQPGTVTVRLRVTDSNSDSVGPESAETAQTITVGAAQAVAGATARPALGVVSTALRRVGRRVPVRVRSSAAGTATVRLRLRDKTLAQGTKRFRAAGTQTVRLALTRRGRSAIRAGRRVRATLVVSLRDAAGARTTITRAARVRG